MILRILGPICTGAVLAALCIGAAETTPPAYRDNRSSPQAVLASLYNAIDRHEWLRAYCYWQGSPDLMPFATFQKGYETAEAVQLFPGTAQSQGAAGSIYTTLPVAIESTDQDGKTRLFAGCYTFRQVNPQLQATPPFQPIFITKGALHPATGPAEAAIPKAFPAD